jgi:hypothetical protein
MARSHPGEVFLASPRSRGCFLGGCGEGRYELARDAIAVFEQLGKLLASDRCVASGGFERQAERKPEASRVGTLAAPAVLALHDSTPKGDAAEKPPHLKGNQ